MATKLRIKKLFTEDIDGFDDLITSKYFKIFDLLNHFNNAFTFEYLKTLNDNEFELLYNTYMNWKNQ